MQVILAALTPPELRYVQMLMMGALPTTPSPSASCLPSNQHFQLTQDCLKTV